MNFLHEDLQFLWEQNDLENNVSTEWLTPNLVHYSFASSLINYYVINCLQNNGVMNFL